MSDLSIAVIAALIGAIAVPFSNALYNYVTYKLTPMRVRKLAKHWKSTWYVNDTDRAETHSDTIKFVQFGPYLWGRAVGQGFSYKVTAKLEPDGIIAGKWKDTQADKDWYGLFKLKLELNGNRMEGKWVGKDNTKIRSGDWIWEKE
ncbi:hypothetical protein MLD52_22460 [Puniceicoccaceae bacterium K14]|nr:hypothetical protein [Puniceicoccaceae bacterium K14]